MSLVPVQNLYLVANFKETQIERIGIGQVARVKIDALDGQALDAVVDSFSPGTGAMFSLLPPENGTGNFTKVVQRVPVRLRLRPTSDVRDRLLPGLSATVRIDTTLAPPVRTEVVQQGFVRLRPRPPFSVRDHLPLQLSANVQIDVALSPPVRTKGVQQGTIRLRLRPPFRVPNHLPPGLSATARVFAIQASPARSNHL